MNTDRIEEFKEKLIAGWNSIFDTRKDDKHSEPTREKVVVFIISFLLAMFLWMVVNLSRDYTLNINMPINLGDMPAEQALAEDLPGSANVSVSGEGWKLVNIYSSPPRISVDVASSEINIFDQVQRQLNAMPDLNIQNVEPERLTPKLEERVTKTVPVEPNIEISFRQQYGLIGEPTTNPDSITISGAASLLEEIESWQTDSIELTDINGNISRVIPLEQSNPLIELSDTEVTYEAEVKEFTEGETRVFLQINNLPRGRTVSFSPSFITIRYNVPIDEYNEVQELGNIFIAYVDYNQLRTDATGFVTPQIEQIGGEDYHIELRSFQPQRVAYFMVLGGND